MFTKPFRVKSNTPIEGSERKKVKAELQKCYPTLTEEDLALVFPNKEEMFIMKIETHGGEIVSTHFVGKKPIIFHIRDKLYPTVYLLWILHGKLIPYFTTWIELLSKFQNGADLMLPGVIVQEEMGMRAYGRLKKGETVGVNTSKNSAAIAVGLTALCSEDMYMAGKRGKGIEILHCLGDFLWQVGTKESPPELGQPGAEPPPSMDEAASLNQDETAAAPSEATLSDTTNSTAPSEVTTARPEEAETPSNVEEEEQKNPQQLMDELLDYCFLKALKTSAKKIELPVLTSNFYRLHIVPACPTEKALDVKKTSFKKLSKYLDSVKKEGIIDVKELTKGVESITAIQHGHDRIRFFRLEPEDKPKETATALESVPDMDKYSPPVITRLSAVNAACAPLFAGAYKKGDTLTAQQVRQHLTEYVKQNQLQNESKPSCVILDPILSDVMLKKGEKIETVAWDELMNRCLTKLSVVHQLIFPRQTAPVFVKGELEPIDITTANRSGNKKVTLVSGLEMYRIDLEEFAHRCQVGVAASTTVTSSPAKKGQVVLVQGNQILFVGNLLVSEYGIPKQFIQGFDIKAKKSGKK